MTCASEPSRARRLKQLTHEVHETLDRSIMAAASFDTLPGYVRFVEVQYRFHRDIAAIYADPALSTLLPGLAARCRLELIETDLTAMAPDLDLPNLEQRYRVRGLPEPEASRRMATTRWADQYAPSLLS